MAEDENVDVETPEGEVPEAVESDAAEAAEPEAAAPEAPEEEVDLGPPPEPRLRYRFGDYHYGSMSTCASSSSSP